LPPKTWSDNNQKCLVASINKIKVLLKRHTASIKGAEAEDTKQEAPPRWNEENPPAIETICNLFGLSNFEKSLLLLCAGVELDAEIPQLCAKAHGNPNMTYPTFGLALAALPQAHWSALTPARPLRRFKLIELSEISSIPITASPLRIDERVLHYLTGIPYSERQLTSMARPVRKDAPIVASHQSIVERILFAWKNFKEKLPVVQLWGIDKTSKLIIARKCCTEMGLDLWRLSADLVPEKADEIESFSQLWAREAALSGSGLYISAEEAEPQKQRFVRLLIEQIHGPVFLGTRERWSILNHPTISMEVRKPKKKEQLQLWKSCLGEARGNITDQQLSKLVSQFDLNASAIQAASKEAVLLKRDSDSPFEALWNAGLEVTRPKLAELAQQIVPKARMEDLVLPEREKQLLREIAIHVAQRHKVYEEWGFEAISSRGLGISALFAGPSGTGKTMAAEVLANELRMSLFRIDLSTVVSKYIGETEKNLRRVFDAAEDGGAILFFDEADALFGKRSEVRDSHDRYANIEIGYLLQRMENYQGLAILATNMKNALDPAFMRRIRFIVNMPFPDEKSRAEIWRRIFPPNTPTSGLDYGRLARLNITGGTIRNIALNASFLAADEGVSVNMKLLKRAVKAEYAKLGHPLTRSELGDW